MPETTLVPPAPPSPAPGSPPPATPPPAATVAFPENWKDGLPEDLRADPTVAQIKSVPDAIRMMVNGQKMIGADKIALPGKNATAEQILPILDRLGRPADAKGYELPKPQLPDGLALDQNLQTSFLEVSQKIGLLPFQARGLYEWWNKFNSDGFMALEASQEQAQREADAALHKEWGQAYDQKLNAANRAVKKLAGNAETFARLDEKFGDDPDFLRLMAVVGEGLSEATGEGGDGTGFGESRLTPAQAKAEMLRLDTDPEFSKAYLNKDHPGHQAAVARKQTLFQQAFPGQTPIATVNVR